MKVGIFGDSFAAASGWNDWFQNPHIKSWSYYVQKSNPYIDITNYAIPGSSIYFTYKNFITHHHNFDKVIVCGTDSARIWLPNTPTEWDVTHSSITSHRVKALNMCPKEIKDAISGYFSHIINIKEQDDIRMLQVCRMLQLRPDVLYFDCFAPDKQYRHQHYPGIGPNYMDLAEISNLAPGGEIPNPDIRANHMSEENNIIFAAKITNWINTSEFEMNITDFQKEK